MPLVPFFGYQGGKRRYAARIAAEILSFAPARVYDIGVGSGAVTLALIAAGVDPARITAVDAGPCGDVWAAIGRGVFDPERLRGLLSEARARPPQDMKRWVEQELATRPYSPEVFVVMQAASFGSSPVWHDGVRWRRGDGERGYCARGHWEPGPHSKETKPRGTIFAADKIVATATQVCARARGVDGRRVRVEDLSFEPRSVVYIDPPYEGTTGYGYAMDWRSVPERHRPVLVSEGRPIEAAPRVVALDARKGGSLRGTSTGRGEEFLNVWP